MVSPNKYFADSQHIYFTDYIVDNLYYIFEETYLLNAEYSENNEKSEKHHILKSNELTL